MTLTAGPADLYSYQAGFVEGGISIAPHRHTTTRCAPWVLPSNSS